MLEVTQRPEQTIGSETSTWNAVGNPILYKMQRKDFEFDQINDNTGDIQLQFTSENVAANFGVGDIIYIKSDNDVYDLFATVTASAFSTHTLVTVDAAYISAAPGGFTNNDYLRPNYRVDVEIYSSDDDEILTDTILENSPDPYGLVTINVSSILRAFLSPNNDADLTSTTESFDDTNVYLGFYIKYREVWDESGETQTDDVANQFFAVLGARQIPSLYGGNMGEYAVNVGDTENIILNQTDFNTGWDNQGGLSEPWTIGNDLELILDTGESQLVRRSLVFEGGKRYAINIIGTLSDQGGAQFDLSAFIGGTQEVFLINQSVGGTSFDESFEFTSDDDYTYFDFFAFDSDYYTLVIEDVIITLIEPSIKFLTKLERPVMWVGYPSLIGIIINEDVTGNVYLMAGEEMTASADYAGKVIEYDLNQIITDQTVEEVSIVVHEDGSQAAEYSETLTVELRYPCDNPILLVGRNSLGGPLSWMFDVNQEYTFDYGNNKKNKRLILTTENLTLNQWESLQDFITLGEVYRNNIVEFTSSTNKTHTRVGQQLYVVDSDGNKIGVIAIPTKNRTDTRQKKHTFQIEIEYPEVFTA